MKKHAEQASIGLPGLLFDPENGGSTYFQMGQATQ
jgi:hypothetical protein